MAAWIAAGLVGSSLVGGMLGKKKKVQPPTPYQQAMMETAAYRDSQPTLLATDQQYLPAFADLNNQIALSSADTLTAGDLALQQKYGGAYVDLSRDLAKRADPNGYAAYDTVGQQILANLGMGDSLSDTERQNVQQSTRGAQAARGNLFGSAPAFEEVLNLDTYGRQRGQQRRAEAMQFIAGEAPMSQGLNLNYQAPDAGGADYATLRGFGQQQANAQMQATQFNMSQTNPWLQAIGQIGGQYLGSYAGAKGAKAANS